jgi:DNA sulfur modification protein DndC
VRRFYEPTAENLARLAGPWCCAYSGGKDSTALVTWLEWLRRAGWLTAPSPMLVRSDTGVEDPALAGVAGALTALLAGCGWVCGLVTPAVHERLYPQVLGRGLPPIHPGVRRMRWCTRSTKIDPMARWRGAAGVRLTLTGLRLGESAQRDAKLAKGGCSAGGECGIPEPGEYTYSPLLCWTTCQVLDWLQGDVGREARALLADLLPLTRQLVAVYGFETAATLFGERELVRSSRFGCVGCPAIGAEAHAPASVVRRNGPGSPLNDLYAVWHEARQPGSRLVGFRRGKPVLGPLRMDARRRLFARVADVQARAGVVLVTPEDEGFIRDCWARRVYPRGWSEADEATAWPCGPLFEAPPP